MGTLSMHAALLVLGAPAPLADWNNLHNEDPELANLWHCGVYPTAFAKTPPRIGVQEIIATTIGWENAMGVIEFEVKEGPVTLCRITQSADGEWKAALAQGTVEENRAKTFGAYGWYRIPGLQLFYRDVLCQHFPHHVAMTSAPWAICIERRWATTWVWMCSSRHHAWRVDTRPPFWN